MENERERTHSSQSRRRRKRNLHVIITVVIALVVILSAILIYRNYSQKKAETARINSGMDYLESLETGDTTEVDDVRRSIYQAKVEANRDEMMRQVQSGEVDPFTMFQDYVLLGDSRAVSFSYYGFLEDSRVLADSGDRVSDIESHIDTVVSMNPANIYLCYGINDIDYWKSAEKFVEVYMENIAKLQQKLPDAIIVVSSILPTTEEASSQKAIYTQVPQWNEVLEDTCEENEIIFVDSSQLYEEHADLWGTDGIHLKAEFYPYWATELIMGTLMGGASDEE